MPGSSKPTVMVTGGQGLVGSVFVRDFSDTYQFQQMDLSGEPSVDITNQASLDQIMASSSAEWVVHFAAFTDVTAAWQQRGDTDGLAYRVNVLGTANIVEACQRYHKKLIHISTAYVFSGEKKGLYLENDKVGAIDWYGETKQLAEAKVLESGLPAVILRIDNPFRKDVFAKPDVVRRLVHQLSEKTLPPQFADSTFGPTVIEDLAVVIDWAIRTDARGIYHATAGESWTQYDFAKAVAQAAGFDPSLVKTGLLTEYLKTSNRPYPYNTALDTTKLRNVIDRPLKSVTQALLDVAF